MSGGAIEVDGFGDPFDGVEINDSPIIVGVDVVVTVNVEREEATMNQSLMPFKIIDM